MHVEVLDEDGRRHVVRVRDFEQTLIAGIATIVTLVTLTRSMSSDIERKMDEFGRPKPNLRERLMPKD